MLCIGMKIKLFSVMLFATILICTAQVRGNDNGQKTYHFGMALGLTAGFGHAFKIDFSPTQSAYFTGFFYYDSYSDPGAMYSSVGAMYQNKIYKRDMIDFALGAGTAFYFIDGRFADMSLSPAFGFIYKHTSPISLSLMISNPIVFSFFGLPYIQSVWMSPMVDIAIFYRLN